MRGWVKQFLSFLRIFTAFSKSLELRVFVLVAHDLLPTITGLFGTAVEVLGDTVGALECRVVKRRVAYSTITCSWEGGATLRQFDTS